MRTTCTRRCGDTIILAPLPAGLGPADSSGRGGTRGTCFAAWCRPLASRTALDNPFVVPPVKDMESGSRFLELRPRFGVRTMERVAAFVTAPWSIFTAVEADDAEGLDSTGLSFAPARSPPASETVGETVGDPDDRITVIFTRCLGFLSWFGGTPRFGRTLIRCRRIDSALAGLALAGLALTGLALAGLALTGLALVGFRCAGSDGAGSDEETEVVPAECFGATGGVPEGTEATDVFKFVSVF